MFSLTNIPPLKKILLCLFLLTSLSFYAQTLTAIALTTSTPCNGTSFGEIFVMATGGTEPYYYTKDYGVSYQTSNRFELLSPGTYIIQVKDANNNFSLTTPATIEEPSTLVATAAVVKPIDCVSNAIVTITAIGGTAPYTYSFDETYNFYAVDTFTGLPPGTHNLFVKDANGCISNPNSITLYPSTPVNISSTIINASCNGNNDGSIIVNATGGQSPYTYAINNGTYSTINLYSGLAAGAYNLSVKDVNSCTSSMIATIMEPAALSATTVITKPIDCISNAIITATATGGQAPYTYSINNGPYSDNNTFSNLVAGTYSIVAKDTNSCITNTNSQVISPLLPLIETVATTNVHCNGNNDGSITVNAIGGQAPYTYSINNGPYSSSTVFSNLAAGVYNLSAKDANGCLSTITTTIIQPVPLTLTAAVTKPIDCISNAIITTTATGGQAPYIFSINNGPYSANNTFSNLVAGTYNLVVRDAIGCLTNVFVTIEPSSATPLNVSTTTANVICKGNSDGSISIRAIGGVAPFSYSIDNGTPITTNTPTILVSNLAPKTYDITVTDANNCSLSTVATIVEPVILSMMAAITKPIDCISNATVTLTATGGTAPYTYSKDGITFLQSNIFSDLTAGTYTTYVKDVNGCIVENSIVISPLPALTAVIIVTPINCYGNNTGTITINAAGGSGQYTYSINGGPTHSGNIFYNLEPGFYDIRVTSNNCIVSYVAVITQPASPLTYTYTVSNATKSGLNDGSITITATGGQGIIKYAISPSLNIFTTNNKFSNLAPSTYQVIAQDENGCYITNSFTIYTPDPLIVTTVTKSIDCVNNATVTVAATGGTPPYTYSKDGINFVQSNVFDNLVAGTYTTYVKDANGDIGNANPIVISTFIPLNAVLTTTPILCNGDNNGTITINATGGSGHYTYSINGSTPQSNSIYSNLGAGMYTFIISDNIIGCTIAMAIQITEPAPLSTSVLIDKQRVTINVTGGSGDYDYALDNGTPFQVSNIFNDVVPGSHYIMTRDIIGCMVISPIFTINPPAPLVNGNNIINQNFTLGQTLADLLIPGENIKWYSTPNASTAKTSKKAAETPLPLSTVLVDNTTYYASQTINGIESTERLAVTAKLGSLGTTDLVIKDFTFYPNPVKNVLTITNTSLIDEVTLISIKGETLLTKKINNLRSEIDLSNFSKGVYFLKVKAEGTEKTVKLIKE
jgi:guanyl-specific ribonuclease Sa